MPQNYELLGLANMILPGARVIHCTRDPLDIAISCFFQSYSGGMAWTNRIEWIGVVLQQYLRLMKHWGEVLSLPVTDVHADAVMADPTAARQALVRGCGLEPAEAEEDTTQPTEIPDRVALPTRRAERYTRHIQPLFDMLRNT